MSYPKRLEVIVPTFDTKVTEYLCSGWVFFLQTNFDFLTSHFDGIFKVPVAYLIIYHRYLNESKWYLQGVFDFHWLEIQQA